MEGREAGMATAGIIPMDMSVRVEWQPVVKLVEALTKTVAILTLLLTLATFTPTLTSGQLFGAATAPAFLGVY
jgi:hypothetical protein